MHQKFFHNGALTLINFNVFSYFVFFCNLLKKMLSIFSVISQVLMLLHCTIYPPQVIHVFQVKISHKQTFKHAYRFVTSFSPCKCLLFVREKENVAFSVSHLFIYYCIVDLFFFRRMCYPNLYKRLHDVLATIIVIQF